MCSSCSITTELLICVSCGSVSSSASSSHGFTEQTSFPKNIKEMLGFKINAWFTFCWKYMSPAVTLGILIFSIVTFKPVKYNAVYEYPWWAIAFGWFLALSSVIAIPVYCVVVWMTTPKEETWRLKWNKLTTSSPSDYVVQEGDINSQSFQTFS